MMVIHAEGHLPLTTSLTYLQEGDSEVQGLKFDRTFLFKGKAFPYHRCSDLDFYVQIVPGVCVGCLSEEIRKRLWKTLAQTRAKEI